MKLLMALLVSALAPLAFASEGLHASSGNTSAFPWGNTGIVLISGPVDEAMLESLRPQLEQMPNSIRTLEITLDSGGGQNKVGDQIIELLRAEKRKGRHLITRVRNGAVCASMCLPIYLQGDERFAGPASSFMFHAVHASFGYGGIARPEQTARYLQYFREAGVSSVWLDQAIQEGVFDSPQPTWYNGQELLAANANLVLAPLPRKEQMRSLTLFGQTFWF